MIPNRKAIAKNAQEQSSEVGLQNTVEAIVGKNLLDFKKTKSTEEFKKETSHWDICLQKQWILSVKPEGF